MARAPGRQNQGRSMSVGDLALELGCVLEGDGDVLVDGVASLAEADSRDLSFVRSDRYAAALGASGAGAVIAPQGIDAGERPVIRSPHPGLHFARATRWLVPAYRPPDGVASSASISPEARVDATASVGDGCSVGARSVVGRGCVLHANVTLYPDVTIGADCELHAGCVLREGTQLGDRVVLQPGVVIGGDGFSYLAGGEGIEKVPQVGRVVIEDDVEIGANTTVDRGGLDDTTIGRAAKIDNLVQIAHGCRIGEEVIIIAQAGLSGSSVVERGAVVMGQAGVVGHLTIGERAVVGPQTGVHKDVKAGTRVLGTPQRDVLVQRRIIAALPRIPELLRRVRRLERRRSEEKGPDGSGVEVPDRR